MSVSASVFCLDCRQFAPRIGDGGAVGFPSLDDVAPVTGDYVAFGYLQKAFDTIGYKPWEMEAVAAFLNSHRGHEISLFLENEDVRYDSWDRDEDEPGPLADVSDATRFVFEDGDFVNGFYTVTCEKCGESFRSGPERLRDFAPLALTTPRINMFLERVRESDGTNFHRVFRLLDYYEAQEKFAGFLTRHKGHAPMARLVQEESWHADRSRQELPWRLAWQKADPLRSDREPLVAGGRIFAIGDPDPSQKNKLSSTLHCFSLDGEAIWKRELSGAAFVRPELTPHGLVVQCGLQGKPTTYEILGFDPNSGEMLWSGTTTYAIAGWLPGREGYIGRHAVYEDPREQRIAVVQLPALTRPWEWVDPVADILKWSDYRGAGIAKDAVVLTGGGADRNKAGWARCLDTATGRERWFTLLDEFGVRSGRDVLCWQDLFLLFAGGLMVALDMRDGTVAWTCEAPFTGWQESHDLVAGLGGGVGLVDLRQHRLRYLTKFEPFGAAPEPHPRLSPLSSRLVVDKDEILFVDNVTGRLWGLDIDSGLPIWMHRPINGVTGRHPVLAGDRLIIQGPGLCCYERRGT
jgi:outer membrane protein assembly factor BamB